MLSVSCAILHCTLALLDAAVPQISQGVTIDLTSEEISNTLAKLKKQAKSNGNIASDHINLNESWLHNDYPFSPKPIENLLSSCNFPQ
jgi:hypothetical protein